MIISSCLWRYKMQKFPFYDSVNELMTMIHQALFNWSGLLCSVSRCMESVRRHNLMAGRLYINSKSDGYFVSEMIPLLVWLIKAVFFNFLQTKPSAPWVNIHWFLCRLAKVYSVALTLLCVLHAFAAACGKNSGNNYHTSIWSCLSLLPNNHKSSE